MEILVEIAKNNLVDVQSAVQFYQKYFADHFI